MKISDIKNPPTPWLKKNIIAVLLLSLSLAIITSYFHHFTHISWPNSTLVSNNHLEVTSFKAEAPLQYRLASYFVAQGVLDISVKLGAPNNSVSLLFIYTVIRIVVLTFAYLALLAFLGIWFDMKGSILGLCFLVAVNPLAEYFYFHQPADPWMLLAFILGFLAIARNRDVFLIPIILLSVPFHESIALLIPAWFFARYGKMPLMKLVLWTTLLCIAWLIPYSGLRFIFGVLPEIMDQKLSESQYTSVFDLNLKQPRGWLVLFLCFNVLWAAVPLAWKQMPSVVRRMFGMVPIYILVYLFTGHLIEGRHFMPLVPLFIVAGLTWLNQSESGSADARNS